MKITFPAWPIWNYHFAEKDVRGIRRITYRDPDGEEHELPRDRYRLAISRHGVSALVFVRKNQLPPIAERADAVVLEYSP